MTLKVTRQCIFLIFSILAAGTCGIEGSWAQAADSVERYGAYNLYSQGSGRAIALGGAYTALSRGVSGMVYNPSGMALGDWSYDVSGTFNRTTNQAAEIEGVDQVDDRTPVDYSQGGVAIRSGSWVVGLGLSVPYVDNIKTSFSSDNRTASLQVLNGNVAIAKSWGRSFSVGLAYHYEQVSMEYADPSSSIFIEEKVEGGYPSLGLLYEEGKSAVGISYRPRREYEVNTGKDDSYTSVNFLRGVVIPSRFSIGLLAHPKKRWLVTIDAEFVESLEGQNVKAFGPSFSSFSSYTSPQDLNTEAHSILRVGTEWAVVQSRSTDVVLRGGFYNEPARLALGKERKHYTFGVEVRFGPALLSVSFDQSDEFNNTAQSLSLAWGSI